MGSIDAAAEPHIKTFLQGLDSGLRRFGVEGGLSPVLRDAVRATPRHRFVHRFRESRDGPLRDFDAAPEELLPLVYRGSSLTHVDAGGAALPSTNSDAAYVLRLVDLLGIEPGDRVLEIGSGSGWLAGVMAHLAGRSGRVTGVEIIPELAEQSGRDLFAIDRTNVTIVAADATRDAIPGAPFARAIITAATWDLPVRLFDLVEEDGTLIVPLRLSPDEGCEVAVLRRRGKRFVAETTFAGFFVPLVGLGQAMTVVPRRLDAFLDGAGLDRRPCCSSPLWFGAADRSRHGPAAWAFRRHLALTEPDFVVFATENAEDDALSQPFGIQNLDGRSVALCRNGALVGWGSPAASRRLVGAYRRWTDLGMPGPSAYGLEIASAAEMETIAPECILHRRGASNLVWKLDPEAGAWQIMLGGDAERTLGGERLESRRPART